MRRIIIPAALLLAVLGLVICLRSRDSTDSLIDAAVTRVSVEGIHGIGIEGEALRVVGEIGGDDDTKINELKRCLKTAKSAQHRNIIVRAIGHVGMKHQSDSHGVEQLLISHFRNEVSEVVRGQIMLALLEMQPSKETTAFSEEVALDELEDTFVRQDAIRIIKKSNLPLNKRGSIAQQLGNSKNPRIASSAKNLIGSAEATQDLTEPTHQGMTTKDSGVATPDASPKDRDEKDDEKPQPTQDPQSPPAPK